MTTGLTADGPTGRRTGGSRRDRLVRIAPIVIIIAVAILVSIATPHSPDAAVLVASALAMMVGIGILMVIVPGHRVHPAGSVVLTAVFCLAVGLLREAGGGAQSGYVALLLIPIVWQSLYGGRVELFATLAFVAATWVTPIVLFGDPLYPASQWRGAVLFTVIGGGIGLLLADTTRARNHLLDQLQAAATTDALTGVANRRAWGEVLAREIAQADRSGQPLAVALIDVDHFKRYNDEHGHNAGDDLLVALAHGWRDALRDGDALARWGGEEFVVLFPDTGSSHAVEATVRLLQTCAGVTCSAGVTTWRRGQSPQALLGEADRLLYAAKDAGRNRVATDEGVVEVDATSNHGA
jgi:diguanylate cyclase (GGDEF)-like protein